MIIKKYNIELHRLDITDLELLRQKRNSHNIRERMVYQEIISEKQQLDWFKSIDNIHNLYLIIHYQGKKIGVINGKNANFEAKTSEGGIFIWDEEYLNSIVPALCSIIMHDYNFYVCEFEKTFIKVLKNNAAAITFNKLFGYEILDENTTDNFYNCVLTRERYIERINKYRKSITNLFYDEGVLEIENFSFGNVSDDELIRLYSKLPLYLKEKLNSVLMAEGRILL
ncbi:MAG: hypothetical protein KFKLKKLM_00168 [Flavobacteriales bacterium]|nr:hypothetical protein [Flavobacteriales bacterium]